MTKPQRNDYLWTCSNRHLLQWAPSPQAPCPIGVMPKAESYSEKQNRCCAPVHRLGPGMFPTVYTAFRLGGTSAAREVLDLIGWPP